MDPTNIRVHRRSSAVSNSQLQPVSPEFVKGLFSPPNDASLPRYAAAVGMIWGVFIGAGVMGFCLGLVTLVQMARALTKKKGEDRAPDV